MIMVKKDLQMMFLRLKIYFFLVKHQQELNQLRELEHPKARRLNSLGNVKYLYMKCNNVDKNSCTYTVQAGQRVLQHPSNIKIEPNYKINM